MPIGFWSTSGGTCAPQAFLHLSTVSLCQRFASSTWGNGTNVTRLSSAPSSLADPVYGADRLGWHDHATLNEGLKDLCAFAGVKWMSQPQARVAKEREAEFGIGADAVQAMLCNIGNLVDRIAA